MSLEKQHVFYCKEISGLPFQKYSLQNSEHTHIHTRACIHVRKITSSKKMLLMSEVWFQWPSLSIIRNMCRKQERENGLIQTEEYEGHVYQVNILLKAKWKVTDCYNIKLSAESEKRVESFFIFCNGLLSSTWNQQYISVLLEGIQRSLFLLTWNTSYCKELQEVFKSRLAVMPMGFLCLVAWPSGALTGNRFCFVFNSKHWNLWRSVF